MCDEVRGDTKDAATRCVEAVHLDRVTRGSLYDIWQGFRRPASGRSFPAGRWSQVSLVRPQRQTNSAVSWFISSTQRLSVRCKR